MCFVVDGGSHVEGDQVQRAKVESVDSLLNKLSETKRQQVISERAMAIVARPMGDLMDIGKAMDFSDSKLQQFQGSCPFSVKSQISSMFSEWRNKMGSSATVEAFVKLVFDTNIDKKYLNSVIMKEYADDTTA